MLFALLLLFSLIPVIEFFLLIELGKVVGTWPTIFLVLGTGAIGAFLAKTQGFLLINRIRRVLQQGRMPGREMVSGLCVLVGGVLLITPGLLTDVVGVLLLLPPVHYLVMKFIRQRLTAGLRRSGFYFWSNRSDDSGQEEDEW